MTKRKKPRRPRGPSALYLFKRPPLSFRIQCEICGSEAEVTLAKTGGFFCPSCGAYTKHGKWTSYAL